MNVLEITGLRFGYGRCEVLRGLELAVPEGAVFGFVGQNGAGKTTAMKLALGLLRPDAGIIDVCGERVAYGCTKTNRHVGYLPDVPEFYAYMRPMEYLTLCGEVAGMSAAAIKRRGEELLELVGLAGVKKRTGAFSRGMKQRLGIAQALLHEPRLLICDEPTSALDPIGRKEILDILSSVRGQTTVLFSTHILSDVERICDNVAVLHNGALALSGTLADIKARRRHGGYALELAPEAADMLARDAELAAAGAVVTRDGGTIDVSFQSSRDCGGLLIARLAALGIVPSRFEARESTLESLFMEVVG